MLIWESDKCQGHEQYDPHKVMGLPLISASHHPGELLFLLGVVDQVRWRWEFEVIQG